MPIRLLFFVPLLFCATIFAQDTAVQSEAARFAKEAEFLRKQERYEAAVEKAETAAALDPKNVQYAKELANSLVLKATVTMHPMLVRASFTAPNSYPKVERNGMDAALQLARQALDVIHSIPDAYIGSIISGQLFEDLTTLRSHFVAIAKIQHPDLKGEVDRFNRNVLEHWKQSYDSVSKNVKDEKNFEKFCFFTYWLPCVRHQPESDAAVMYEKMIADLVRFSKRWPDNARAYYAARELCSEFAAFAAAYRTSGYTNSIVDASLERSYKTMESASIPVFSINGWIARNKINAQIGPHKGDKEATQRRFKNLKAKLESLPNNLQIYDYSILYDEAAVLVHYGDKNESIRSAVEILETANTRNEFARRLTATTHFLFATDKKSLDHFKDELPRLAMMFDKQVELAANFGEEEQKDIKMRLAFRNLFATASETARPWLREIPIVADPHRYYRRVLVHDDKLYVFFEEIDFDEYGRQIGSQRIRVDEFDLKLYTYKKGKPFPCVLRGGSSHSPATLRYDAACADNHNVYYGAYGGGVVVFPHGDSTPWTLTVEDGLPSDFVQAVEILNGKLYVGLGEEKKASWLIVIDVKTRQWDILASSNAKEGKFPFYNLSPAPRFGLFVTDSKRNRLLLAVEPNDHKNLGGLWTINGETGEIDRTYPFPFAHIMHGHILSDGDRMLLNVGGSWPGTFMIDLASSNPQAGAVELLTTTCKEYRETENWKLLTAKIPAYGVQQGTIWKGYLWGVLYCMDPKDQQKFSAEWQWARVSVDGKTDFELLRPIERPPEAAKYPWTPDIVCLPMPNGKGLIVGNYQYLSLLLFEP